MLGERIANPGDGAYVYWPLALGKPFHEYNIEQQGQMVEDRFRTQPSIGLQPRSSNPGNAAQRYEALFIHIPTLHGFMKLH